MGDNARFEGIKMHSTSHDFGLVQQVSRTRSHPYLMLCCCCRSQEDALIATQFQTAEMINAERERVQMEMSDEVSTIMDIKCYVK